MPAPFLMHVVFEKILFCLRHICCKPDFQNQSVVPVFSWCTYVFLGNGVVPEPFLVANPFLETVLLCLRRLS